jgi:hypothetical protein
METVVRGVELFVVFAVYYAGTEKMVDWIKTGRWRKAHLPFLPFLRAAKK